MAINLGQIEQQLKEILTQALQATGDETQIPEIPRATFDVDTPTGEVDISQLDSLPDLKNQVRDLDIKFASEKEAQEELIKAIEPSPRALELQKEILAERQAGRAGAVAIRGQAIPQPLIGRQAELLREQVELRELPLIEELKLEVQKQQTVFEKAKARLGFETAGIERVLGIEKEFRQMDREQRQDARGLLEGIIRNLEGMAFEDLSSEQQTNLEGIIKNAGVPIEVIKAGMTNSKRLAGVGVEFTTTQKLALEQAGLKDASRQEQLNYLERQGFLRGFGAEPRFTQSQLNKGTASAGMPMSDFLTLTPDTQNLYVSGTVDEFKKAVDEKLDNFEDPTEIEREISEGTSPPAVKDTLVRYLWSRTPRPGAPVTMGPVPPRA